MKSRRVAIVALTAVTASTALAVSGCGIGVHFADYRHTSAVPDAHVSGQVTNVQVNAGNGHVVVTTGGNGDGVTVHRVVHYQSGTPHPTQRLSGGMLTFDSGCSRCRIDYDLVVPASVKLRVRTDSGRINVTGVAGADLASDSASVSARHVAGDVSVHSDSGSLYADDVTGTLTAASDSGSLHGTALRSATVVASSDSGAIHLGFVSPPKTVQASDDSGSLYLMLPGGPYDLHVRTDSGDRDISPQVPQMSTAAAKVDLRTDSGSAHVDPAD